MEHQSAPSNSKKDIGEEYSHLPGAGDSPQVSEHYQYCFRNSPYEDSHQQYRKTGNRIFFLHSLQKWEESKKLFG
jgi:hypothetical protein